MTNDKRAEQAIDDHDVADDAKIATAFRSSLVVIGLLVLIAVGGFLVVKFWPKEEAEELTGELIAPTTRTTEEVEVPKVKFTDMTEAAGIDFAHVNGAQGLKLLPETMGGGVAAFDYDNDGDADLLFVNSCYWPDEQPADVETPKMALYRNDGDWKFVDVTEEAKLDVSFYGMGCAVADFDGDGWRDLFVTGVDGNRLFRNEQGSFVDVTESAGVGGLDGEWSTSCGWFDYDRDGNLDLFVCNYVRWTRELNIQLKPTLDGKNRAYAPPTQFAGRFPYLYHNNGDGTFTEVGEAAGLHIRNPDTGVPVPKSLGIVFVDYNNDNWPDVFVANDVVPNLLFENQKDGTFSDVGVLVGIAYDKRGQARGAMGMDAAYHRNDDSLSIAIGNFADEPTSLYVFQGRQTFTDEATATGLGPQTEEELTFGVMWFDYDLDGRLDFLSSNGHLENEIEKIRENQRYAQEPHLFWNAGPENPDEFISVDESLCGKDICKPMVGRGSASADFDLDGDLDLILAGCGQPPRLLRNEQDLNHHWLRVKLRDRGSNWEALGAVVRVRVGDRVMTRVVSPTRSYLSQSESVASFGLGEQASIDGLEVTWPDGTTESYDIDAVDQLHVIERESDAASGSATSE